MALEYRDAGSIHVTQEVCIMDNESNRTEAWIDEILNNLNQIADNELAQEQAHEDAEAAHRQEVRVVARNRNAPTGEVY